MEDLTQFKDLFLAIGMDAKTVDNTLKNKKVTQRLKEVIDTAGVTSTDKIKGNLLYGVATKLPESCKNRTKLVTDYILSDKITRTAQLDEAIEFLKNLANTLGGDAEVNIGELEKACGVGIVVTDEDI